MNKPFTFQVGDKFQVVRRDRSGKEFWITRTVGCVWRDKAGEENISEKDGYNPIQAKFARKA